MTSLDEYLRGEFSADQEAIHRVRDTADQALRTLQSFSQDGQWPYEVANAANTALKEYSFSTSAMILYAMASASGQLRPAVLVPSTALRNEDEMPDETRNLMSTVGETLRAGLLRFLKERTAKAKTSTKTPAPISWSQTFGENDPFTLLWLIELLDLLRNVSDLNALRTDALTCAFEMVRKTYEDPSPAALLTKEGVLDHAFPVLRVVHLNNALKKQHPNYRPPDSTKVLRYLRNKLHDHLSYSSIPDSSFDSAELAFAMEGLLLIDPNILDEPHIKRCFTVFDEHQQRNPYWRPLRPFIATQQGMALLPLSVEIANSLLRSCDILDTLDRSRTVFSNHIQLFKRYTNWLFTRVVCGADDQLRDFTGWHSEHADDPGKVHLWETSQVLLYLIHYEALLRRHRAERSLRYVNLRGQYLPRQADPIKAWQKVIDEKEPLSAGIASSYTVFSQIADHYIKPRIVSKTSSRDWHYSMLLYGPQGTGKTGLAEDLARVLEYPLITVTPGDFTLGGEHNVEARAKAIFEVLIAQSEAVIIFDEIDRLVLDRDSLRYQQQSDIFQLMTPGMLTKLRDLRKTQRSIFIVSTNLAERIDQPIKRPGRIDDHYLLLPPDAQQRRRILQRFLSKYPDSISKLTLDDDQWKPVLKLTPLMVFGELRAIVQQAVKSDPITAADLAQGMQSAAKVTEPSIRLQSYRSRFNWRKGTTFLSNQEPYDEFLLLVYLSQEVDKDYTHGELSILKSCAEYFKKEHGPGGVAEGISRHVNSQEVSKLVGAALDLGLRKG
jgi:hypothetical protein